jgi:hypothetical protein
MQLGFCQFSVISRDSLFLRIYPDLSAAKRHYLYFVCVRRVKSVDGTAHSAISGIDDGSIVESEVALGLIRLSADRRCLCHWLTAMCASQSSANHTAGGATRNGILNPIDERREVTTDQAPGGRGDRQGTINYCVITSISGILSSPRFFDQSRITRAVLFAGSVMVRNAPTEPLTS